MDIDHAVARVRNGDSDAFGEIIDLTERRLRAFLALQVPDRELVDEVAHQAYITAYKKLSDYQPGTSFYHWLRRIAQNHLQNECRKRQSSTTLPAERLAMLVAPDPDPTQSEETDERIAQLQRCVKRLGPEARRLLEMRYTECLEPTEIAAKLGRAASAVRTALTRLRQSLLQCMEAGDAV